MRGRPILLGIFDELAYWRDENSAKPDEEFYRAIEPGLITLASAGSRIIAISSPYRKSGLLYKNFKDSFGKDRRPDPCRAGADAHTQSDRPSGVR